MKHFLKLLDVTTEEIYELLDLAAVMKKYVKEYIRVMIDIFNKKYEPGKTF